MGVKRGIRKKTFGHKIVVFLSVVLTLLLVMAYLLPFVEPKVLKGLAALSLLTPFIILVNVIFMLIWLFKMERYFWLHFLVLALGYPYLVRFYKLGGEKVIQSDDVKIMSYNVRMFNKYNWLEDKDIPQKINEFIEDKSPDIVSFQDYAKNAETSFDFPYKFEKFPSENARFGQAIFSKFPIVGKGSLDFQKTANNIIYADIKIEKDTFRIYNVHLQSIKLNPKKEYFGEIDAEHLQMRISQAFQVQQEQVELFLEHQSKCKYPVMITGDFNNTAYSWVYRKMLQGKKDAFSYAGVGLDPTYDFEFPLRIDFILLDKSMKINYFKTYKEKYSDHFPILARIDRKSLVP